MGCIDCPGFFRLGFVRVLLNAALLMAPWGLAQKPETSPSLATELVNTFACLLSTFLTDS